MNFSLNETQLQLQDATARMLREHYSFEQRKQICASSKGWSKAIWQNLADLGLLGVALPESVGGSEIGFRELCVISEQLGRHMVAEPYIPVVAIAASLVQAMGTATQQVQLLGGVNSGQVRVVLAHAEPGWRDGHGQCSTSAAVDGLDFVLNGSKSVVLGGGAANKFLVSAGLHGSDRVALFVIDADAPGVERRDYPVVGGGTACDLRLTNVRVSPDFLLGHPAENASLHIERAQDLGTAAACNEAVGTMQTMFELTLEHIKTRQQFGAPLGALQVVQHKAVDMLTALELARSMASMVAEMVTSVDRDQRTRLVSAAKVQVNHSARTVAQNGVQLHGGMGITQECAAAHCMARLTAFSFSHGGTSFHLARYAG